MKTHSILIQRLIYKKTNIIFAKDNIVVLRIVLKEYLYHTYK